MQFESVKHIAQYYKAIPGMLRLLQQEREELEGNYYGPVSYTHLTLPTKLEV